MSAFEEGLDAYNNGDDIDVNPYDERDAQFDEWLAGWEAGLTCEKEEGSA